MAEGSGSTGRQRWRQPSSDHRLDQRLLTRSLAPAAPARGLPLLPRPLLELLTSLQTATGVPFLQGLCLARRGEQLGALLRTSELKARAGDLRAAVQTIVPPSRQHCSETELQALPK